MYVSRYPHKVTQYYPFPARQITRIAVACGRMALSKLRQPTSAVGPSWSQRASREARLAFRQAQRRGDRRGAMDIASTAEARSLNPEAGIGTAEGRVAGQAAQREADVAAVSEMSDALTPPARTAAAKIGTAPAQPGTTPSQTGTAAFQQRQELAGNATAPNPAPPTPVPGASQVPENPVSGASTPQTGDVVSRLANRRQSEQQPDFLSRVRSLTSADGENLTRKDAIIRANEERVRSGKAPLDVDSTLDDMLEQDRAPDRGKQIGSALNRGPIGSPDPTLARTFRGAGPLRQPARPIAEPPAAQPPPPAAAPTGSPEFQTGQRVGSAIRGLTPPAVAGSVLGSAPRALSPLARGVATATAEAEDAKRTAARLLIDRVAGAQRTRRRAGDLVRGLISPR